MMVKVHRVIEGPFPDFEEEEYFNLCLVEFPNGTLENMEIYFDDMNGAYAMIKQLSTTIEPIEVDFGDQGVDYV